MIRGKSVLAVVPARGGSKGVPLKNLRPVNGVPLVAMVGGVVKELPAIDRAVVSTDHPEIARVAQEAGLDAPFMRPAELSGDIVGDWDVMVHALGEMEKRDRRPYDVVLMLQPTSPLRKPAHVQEVLNKLVHEGLDAVWTVTETDVKFHPLKQLTVQEGRLGYFDERAGQIIARQQLGKVYHRNGVAYAMTRQCLLEQKRIMGVRSGAVIINEPLVNIDSLNDFEKLENFFKTGVLDA